jgi:hypothetical protein
VEHAEKYETSVGNAGGAEGAEEGEGGDRWRCRWRGPCITTYLY